MSFCFSLTLLEELLHVIFSLKFIERVWENYSQNKIKWGKSSSRQRRRSKKVVLLMCVNNFLIFFEEDLFGYCWTWKLHFFGFGIVGGREFLLCFLDIGLFNVLRGFKVYWTFNYISKLVRIN
jgi:hypothetical protein